MSVLIRIAIGGVLVALTAVGFAVFGQYRAANEQKEKHDHFRTILNRTLNDLTESNTPDRYWSTDKVASVLIKYSGSTPLDRFIIFKNNPSEKHEICIVYEQEPTSQYVWVIFCDGSEFSWSKQEWLNDPRRKSGVWYDINSQPHEPRSP